jgi:hypothetical protein
MKHIFYNTVTGDIYSVKKMDHRQAEYQCGKNAQFNMSCIPEAQVGFVFDVNKQKIDLETMTLVSKEQPVMVTVPNQIRLKRNNLLKSSDWTQVPDGPLNDTQRTAWQTYRTALRAINPDDYTSLSDVTWPTAP